PGSNRYTKNYSRNDNELRAEATDYHRRQPYSVMAGVLFLPADSCDDAAYGQGQEAGTSSFAQAVRYFHDRAGRQDDEDEYDLFERFFIGLYKGDGTTCFFDVMKAPPRAGRPFSTDYFTLAELAEEIIRTYKGRNERPFFWAFESPQ